MAVWTRMAGIFGERWTRTHGELPGDEWVATLARLSDAALARALKHLQRLPANSRGEVWPPLLVDFVQLCRLRREDLGLPDEAAVFALMRRAAEQHRRGGEVNFSRLLLVHLFQRLVRAGFLEAVRHEHQWALFARAWERLLLEVEAGFEPGPLVLALPAPAVRQPVDAAQRRQLAAESVAACRRALAGCVAGR